MENEIEYDQELSIQAIKVMEECLVRKGRPVERQRKRKREYILREH